jgi:hypothetical protein
LKCKKNKKVKVQNQKRTNKMSMCKSIMEVVEREVECMLVRISAKYGMSHSELREVAHGVAPVGEVERDLVVEHGVGEVESHQVCGEVESDLDVAPVGDVESHRECDEVESHQVCEHNPEVQGEWLLEVDESDDKEKLYEELDKLCEDLESSESVVEMNVHWYRVMSLENMLLCESDGILKEKSERALKMYVAFKDGFDRQSGMSGMGVEESKSELEGTVLMSESSLGEEMSEWEAKMLLMKIMDDVSLCSSVSEVDMLWSEVSKGCVSVCNSSDELSKKLQEAIKEVGSKKESLRMSSVSEESISLMEESYHYVKPSVSVVPTVEVSAVEVSAVEVSAVEVVSSKKSAKEKVAKDKPVKEKASKEKPVKVAKEKVAKEKVVKEKVAKDKPVKEKVAKEKKVKESEYRSGLFASLVSGSASCVEESKEESDVEEEASSVRCYISKKEAACAAAQNMSSSLPKLKRSSSSSSK